MKNIEYEARYYPINSKDMIKKILDLGARQLYVNTTMKRVIYNIDQSKRKWLRIRQHLHGTEITIKEIVDSTRIDGTYETQTYFNEDRFQDLIKIFDGIGMTKLSYQENRRSAWSYQDNIIITIDEWPSLEPLLEIEGKSNEQVLDIATQLGLEKHFEGAISEIYSMVYNISREEFNAIKELTFNTPFPFNRF